MTINEERTFVNFGYVSNELSHGSSKKVWAICNNCGKERLNEFKSYRKLCLSCTKKDKMTGKNNPMYGKHHTRETKSKLSKAFSGKNNPMYGKTGKKSPRYGKVHSKESKQKMRDKALNVSNKTKQKRSTARIGKKHTEKTKRKISKANSGKFGDKSSNWQGGKSFGKYCSKFNNKLKENIRERDNNTCQLCGKFQDENKRKLTVHHIHYDKENCAPDLITLCLSCNSKVNKYRDYWEQYFMRLLLYNNIKIEIYNIENELNIWNYGNF